MDKTKYTKRIYKEIMEFKEYVDKLLADSNDYNKEPDIWENETIFQVAKYYEDQAKNHVSEIKKNINLKFGCSCEKGG